MLVADCDTQRACHALGAQVGTCRAGRWLTVGDAVKVVQLEEAVRRRTWEFFSKLVTAAQMSLRRHRERWQELHAGGQQEAEEAKSTEQAIDRLLSLVDDIAMQLYFASGAFADKRNKDEGHLTEPQKRRFWMESAEIFRALSLRKSTRTPLTRSSRLSTTCSRAPLAKCFSLLRTPSLQVQKLGISMNRWRLLMW